MNRKWGHGFWRFDFVEIKICIENIVINVRCREKRVANVWTEKIIIEWNKYRMNERMVDRDNRPTGRIVSPRNIEIYFKRLIQWTGS